MKTLQVEILDENQYSFIVKLLNSFHFINISDQKIDKKIKKDKALSNLLKLTKQQKIKINSDIDIRSLIDESNDVAL